jgi:diaminohydroxyphosphoribosylaminopyrimidine deaminase / 5-amino-6-(5-phosphoribosylamino)uracil reductase
LIPPISRPLFFRKRKKPQLEMPAGTPGDSFDSIYMQRALKLAERGYGGTSPNPLVGAVVVREGKILGEGYHRRAGEPHAEINAIREAGDVRGATLYVTLEPCSTHGRTPPCTEAILASGISRVVAAARDPNPAHAGRGLRWLRAKGLQVEQDLLADEARCLNEAFNHWITRRRPFVHLKCAMSLDGKIATNSGESKWITGPKARAYGMRLRLGADAIVAGINTIVRDDPLLNVRGARVPRWKKFWRVVIDPDGRIPANARVLASETTLVVTGPNTRPPKVPARILTAPRRGKMLDLDFVLRALEAEGVTSLLIEGGGETHYQFLAQGLVQRVHFFYAPKIITGRAAPKGIGGEQTLNGGKGLKLRDAEWRTMGKDLLLTALVQ